MEQIILISKTLGCDICSRSNVERMKESMSNNHSYVFDMQNVTFISRSVADEFYNLAHYFTVKFINKSEFVDNMLKVVAESRHKHRQRNTKDTQIIECNDMDSLSAVLTAFA